MYFLNCYEGNIRKSVKMSVKILLDKLNNMAANFFENCIKFHCH